MIWWLDAWQADGDYIMIMETMDLRQRVFDRGNHSSNVPYSTVLLVTPIERDKTD